MTKEVQSVNKIKQYMTSAVLKKTGLSASAIKSISTKLKLTSGQRGKINLYSEADIENILKFSERAKAKNAKKVKAVKAPKTTAVKKTKYECGSLGKLHVKLNEIMKQNQLIIDHLTKPSDRV